MSVRVRGVLAAATPAAIALATVPAGADCRDDLAAVDVSFGDFQELIGRTCAR
jgi:hypothetical protein